MITAESFVIVPDQHGRAHLDNVKLDCGIEHGAPNGHTYLTRVKDHPGPGQYTFDKGNYVVGPGYHNRRLTVWVICAPAK